jgi:ppGpp synthetase/RelA/SpoT-type nucleotidyltranferase
MTDIDHYFKNLKDLSEPELKAADITHKKLLEIYFDYVESLRALEAEGIYLSNRLQFCSDINSVRWRTKDPIHLLTKIVRKRKSALKNGITDSPYLSIDVNNYKQIITDLIGLRAIYLFKFQWKLVDKYICNNFKMASNEDITIYHASEDDLTFYFHNGYEKKIGENNFKYVQAIKGSKYRSTHYIVEANFPHAFKLEIQIRSILDEAWGEIDHYIRYPNHQDDVDLERQMTILNGAINGCEELATTYIKYFQDRNREVADVFLEDLSLEGSERTEEVEEEDLSLEGSERTEEVEEEDLSLEGSERTEEVEEEGLPPEGSERTEEVEEEGLPPEGSERTEEVEEEDLSPEGSERAEEVEEEDLSIDFKDILDNLALESDMDRIASTAYPSFSSKLRKKFEEQHKAVSNKSTLRFHISPELRKKFEEQHKVVSNKSALRLHISPELRKKFEEQHKVVSNKSALRFHISPELRKKFEEQNVNKEDDSIQKKPKEEDE